MNPHYEKQLATSVQQELKTLGELSAPPALANRIIQTIEQRTATPWYRQAWPTWPWPLRLGSLLVLLGSFVGLSYGAWELTHLAAAQSANNVWFADAQALWRTMIVLGDVGSGLFHQLGTNFIIISLIIIFAGCATCIGLGSACVRLALRSTSNCTES